MKAAHLILLLFLSCNSFAQKHPYLRIYDSLGKKIVSGKLISISDSSLKLQHNREVIEIFKNSISTIKTRHSTAYRILIPALVGSVVFGIMGAATANENEFVFNTPASAGAIWAGIGASFGSVAGAVIMLFKQSETYDIGSDNMKFLEFKDTLNAK